MLRNVTLCAALLLGSLALGSTDAKAQAANYAFTAGAGTYTEATGGTLLASGSSISSYVSSQSIGFNFVFGGTTYSTVLVNGNGFINFSSADNALSTRGDVFRNINLSSGGVVAAWANLLSGGANSQVSVVTTGSTPSRVTTFQWKNVNRRGLTSTVSSDDMSFQIRLYETSNRIEIVYGSMTLNGAMGADIGVAFGPETPMAVVARSTGSPWSMPAVSRSYDESIALQNWAPASGLTYTFKHRSFETTSNNAGIMALEMPTTKFLPNTNQEIRVRVKNWGHNNLDSVVINWSFNGVNKTPVRYYPQPALAPNAEAVITLGYHTFPAGSFNTLVATTATPNGFVDGATGNDMFQTYMAPRVSGNLSISTGSGNPGVFQNFFQATRHLAVSGVSGDTKVRVFPGEYNEQVIIPNIDNSNGTYNVSFYATQNDEPKITWAPLAFPDGAYSNYEGSQCILTLDGARNITVDNLNFYLQSTPSWGTFVYGDLDYATGAPLDKVTITNCLFQGPDNYASMAITSNAIQLYASGSSPVVFTNNVLDNYRFATYINAFGSANSQINGNVYTDVSTSGYYQLGTGSTVNNNSVAGSNAFTIFDGLYVEGNGPIAISANKIAAEISTGNAFGLQVTPTTGNMTITNNTLAISSGSLNYGIIVNGTSNSSTVYLYHNSANITGAATGTAASALRVNSSLLTAPNFRVEAVNNIFHAPGSGVNGGYAVLMNDATVVLSNPTLNPLRVSDFNNLYTTGTAIGYWDGTSVAKSALPAHPLAGWRTISGRESNSTSVATQFVGGADLHLLAINTGLFGTTLIIPTVPTDIDGQTRVKPYMGADEVKPSIEFNTQPQSRYACLGESFNLLAIANVTPGATVTYQWQKDGQDLIGQTNAVLSFSSVGYGASGVYTVLIKATDGSNLVTKLSDAASVIVVRSTSVTVNPMSTPVALGGTAILEAQAEAIGGPSNFVPTYQWKKRFWNPNALQYVDTAIVDNGRITGTNSNRLTITNVMASDTADEYVLTVTGYCGTATSKTARLFIPLVVAANNTPGNCAGSMLSFEAAAFPSQVSGSGVTFQWYKDGVTVTNSARINGAMGKVLTIDNALATDAGTYYVIATFGTPGTPIRSNDLAVAIGAAPAITTQPTGTSVCEGDTVKATVVANGQGLTYRWSKGTTVIAGQTSATLAIADATAATAGSYTVEVVNSCGSAVSASIDVAVNTKPSITTEPTNQTLDEGAKLTLAVVSSGSPTITYQWYQDGTAITGATSATYEKVGVVGTDNGSYTVVVTNACGSDTSAVAAVSVNTTGVTGDVTEAGYTLTSPVPNPATSNFSFKYTLAAYQNVKITVTDLTGRVITQFNEGAKDAGTYTVNVNTASLNNLQAGVYNYTISAGTFTATNQVVIVK